MDAIHKLSSRLDLFAAQLGHASVDHIPRELRIMGRTIQTQKGKARWYDLPLTEQEIERGNTIGEAISKTERKRGGGGSASVSLVARAPDVPPGRVRVVACIAFPAMFRV